MYDTGKRRPLQAVTSRKSRPCVNVKLRASASHRHPRRTDAPLPWGNPALNSFAAKPGRPSGELLGIRQAPNLTKSVVVSRTRERRAKPKDPPKQSQEWPTPRCPPRTAGLKGYMLQPAHLVTQPDATVHHAGPSAKSRPGTGDHFQTDGRTLSA